jgi:putative spermidine/putrescine transport system ATP-binding protein
MSHVQLESVTKAYGAFHAVDGVDLHVAQGEFVTLLGASGSGKTTCLRMVAGFVAPTVGRVLIGGRDVTNVPPYRRNIGMVFQQYALFPHLTVAENIGYGLKVRRQSSAEVAARTKEALQLVRLEELAHRYPRQLSGGQKQRVALARAVIIKPQVLLLDEPLAALDLKLREELQSEIKRVQQTVGITTMFVTHDQGEALSLSDRVAVMREGKILQIEPPTVLYRRPSSRYVAGFIGRMNFLDVVIKHRAMDGQRHVVALQEDPSVSLEVAGPQTCGFATDEACVLAFRPEITHLGGGDRNTIPVRVSQSTYVGENWMITCAGPADKALTVNVPRAFPVPAPGTATNLTWPSDECLLLKRD